MKEKVRYIKRGSKERRERSTSLARDRQQEYGFLVAEYLWHNRGSRDAEITRWLSILAALLCTQGVPDTHIAHSPLIVPDIWRLREIIMHFIVQK